MEYIQISIDGILYGSSYSLIALGFSLVFGVMRRINLAYGSSLLLGVAIALWAENKLNINIIFFIPIVLFFCSLSNLYVERFCFAPHNTKAGVVVSMISSFAIWMQLDEISSQLLPDRTHSFPSLEISTFEFGGLFFRGDQILNIFIAFIISAVLFLAVYKTKYGIVLRAVSNSADTAKLMGFDIYSGRHSWRYCSILGVVNRVPSDAAIWLLVYCQRLGCDDDRRVGLSYRSFLGGVVARTVRSAFFIPIRSGF